MLVDSECNIMLLWKIKQSERGYSKKSYKIYISTCTK